MLAPGSPRASAKQTGKEASPASALPALAGFERDIFERARLRLRKSVSLRQKGDELGFNSCSLRLGEDARVQFGTQFVDHIFEEHVRYLRLDNVDGRRAPEDRVKDRRATGGAGGRGSRFCRGTRQNWGNLSSLSRSDQP